MKKNFVFIMLVVSLIFTAVGVYGQTGKAAYDRGETAFKQKNWDKAIAEYTEAIKLNPNYTDAYTSRGAAYLEKGNIDLARADVNSALKIDPNNKAAKDLNSKIDDKARLSQIAFLNSIFDNFNSEPQSAPATTWPSTFIGTWKRNNFNNTLTFQATSIKASNQSYTWILIRSSGDSYTCYPDINPSNNFTVTIKLINGNLEISGDSGTGEDNWNGTWRKQTASSQSSAPSQPAAPPAQPASDFEMNGTTLVKYKGNAANVTIPSGVTAIGSYAFNGCSSLTSIIIPSSVISIGFSNSYTGNTFLGCTSLISVTFQGTINSSEFASSSFPGDLRTKYLAADGGIGTYTRTSGTDTWTKQP